ncbi:MAG: (4Fe-4S)-binding protein [Chitinophagaceae bacterium]|nr:(4Fe-4S)-binding protein [Chitinophagaceae bacterium]
MDLKNITKKYNNGEITVVWKPGACIHSTVCWKESTGLPEVFSPKEKPWIKIEGADSARIMDQVKKCPSGALSFYYNNYENKEEEISAEAKVEVVPNGPLLVYGTITIKDQHGVEDKKDKVTAFCRCGLSNNKPYCDGTHIKTRIDG